MASSSTEKDLRADAQNFCDSLANVFMMKRRDPQTQHLLEKSKGLIEALLKDKRAKGERPAVPPKPSRAGSSGGMGQLWVKLDELKRENDALRRKMTFKKTDDKPASGKPQGPGDVVIAELQKCKTENETLKSKLEKAQTNTKELETITSTLQDECKRYKIGQEIAQDSLEKIRRERKSLESSLDTVKTENDTLKLRLTQSVKPMKRPDARLVENINERCRPTTVALQYSELENQHWLDAKETLDDAGSGDEQTNLNFLTHVLMTCYEICLEMFSDVDTGISEIIKDPCKLLDSSYLTCAKNSGGLPDELLLSIKEYMRQNSFDIDVEPLVNKCKERVSMNATWCSFDGYLNLKPLHRYVAECARITWQMVCQQTPMWLDTCATCYDEEVHKLWWSCDRHEANVIKYFIWPALYDSKNGTLLVKGCVFTEPE